MKKMNDSTRAIGKNR